MATEKKYDQGLAARVVKLREGIEPQPLNALWSVDTGLRHIAAKMRRILAQKVFPGDAGDVERMEKAKSVLLSVRY